MFKQNVWSVARMRIRFHAFSYWEEQSSLLLVTPCVVLSLTLRHWQCRFVDTFDLDTWIRLKCTSQKLKGTGNFLGPADVSGQNFLETGVNYSVRETALKRVYALNFPCSPTDLKNVTD